MSYNESVPTLVKCHQLLGHQQFDTVIGKKYQDLTILVVNHSNQSFLIHSKDRAQD